MKYSVEQNRQMLLDWLAQPEPVSPDGAVFSMAYVYDTQQDDCGTACCMAGYLLEVNDLLGYKYRGTPVICEEAGICIGLSIPQAYNLFYPMNYDLGTITAAEARQALINTLQRGSPNWGEILSDETYSQL